MPDDPQPAPAKRRAWLRSPFFWSAVVGVIAVTALHPLLRHVPEPPPVLMQLPHYELIDQDGEPFGSDQLAGHVYVASFFFTSCPSICPKLIGALRGLQDRYQNYGVDIRIVSISVDPENDTPAVLAAYAKRYDANLERWSFLTGTEEQIRKLATKGFLTHLGQRERTDAGTLDIAHTGRIALVDQRGRLRGLYRTDADGLDELFHRSIHVLMQTPRRPSSI